MIRTTRWALALGFLCAGVAAGAFFCGSVSQGEGPVAVIQPREFTSYRDIVKRVLPAVVSIEAKARPKRPPRPENFDRLPPDKQKFFEETAPAPKDGDLGFGSGMIVDRNGTILTNYHVIEGADRVDVKLTDGRKFSTTAIKFDKLTDLAIIRVQAKEPLPFLEFGDSNSMEMGDRVLAFGSPFGLTGSVTAGIVSAKGRNLHLNKYEDFLQTDAAINPGNSGGPLVNLEGKVIGITSAIKSRNGGFQGVGLAIASNFAKSIMEQLLKDGIVHRGYLGIKMDELSPDSAKRLGLPGGVVVKKIVANAPAAKGGLKVGDIIINVAGKAIKDGVDLEKTVAGLPLNESAEITFVRDGKYYKIAVTIVEQPEDFG